jgi:hypothetical protein
VDGLIFQLHVMPKKPTVIEIVSRYCIRVQNWIIGNNLTVSKYYTPDYSSEALLGCSKEQKYRRSNVHVCDFHFDIISRDSQIYTIHKLLPLQMRTFVAQFY